MLKPPGAVTYAHDALTGPEHPPDFGLCPSYLYVTAVLQPLIMLGSFGDLFWFADPCACVRDCATLYPSHKASGDAPTIEQDKLPRIPTAKN